MEPENMGGFESKLTTALDAVADLVGESVPSVEELALLAAQVQREQRRRTLRDLALFWGCAVVILGLLVGGAARSLSFFLYSQAAAIILLVGTATVLATAKKGGA